MSRIKEEIEKLNKQIKEINKKINELKKQGSKKGDIWRPGFNEEYYYIVLDGRTLSDINHQIQLDIMRINAGNYYKTREEAEYQSEVQKYTNLFRKYVEEHSDPIDFTKQSAWEMVYNVFEKRIEYYPEHNLKHQGTIFASSFKVLEQAVDFVGRENVIKYVLGVKE